MNDFMLERVETEPFSKFNECDEFCDAQKEQGPCSVLLIQQEVVTRVAIKSLKFSQSE